MVYGCGLSSSVLGDVLILISIVFIFVSAGFAFGRYTKPTSVLVDNNNGSRRFSSSIPPI
ncbi:small hydrophobic protein [Mint vein banding-associated virus]|uniref:Small hydrophobic protein n=1 Tax=Mint vein banding-associated virus TaxID=265877 RepID=Q6QCI2_9CLOS|nr:small hydrophobic protein [Mint vein banding-associated virus]AAS57940.1 small hydrophobic protein [Mint vein banding-associated virus]